MSEAEFCPKCRAKLVANAPEGICPGCLLQAGMHDDSGAYAFKELQPTADGTSGFVPPTAEELAERFPELEILELLGKGGMGAVYKARQQELERLVAVKILPSEVAADLNFSQRFTREARAMASLSHQNIVTIFDFGQADGQYYFVMEFVDGTNLRQLMEARAVQPDEALAIVPQICDALQYAHQAGVVHRDIKPENILIDKRGQVKIADFGLVKLLDGPKEDSHLTGTHQGMGTPHYMAPEQMLEAASVDNRADIYSLGVVFYEMLTGDLPIGRFSPPSQKIDVDVRLDEVVLRALENEPEHRYQQASEVRIDIASISGSNPSAPPGKTHETEDIGDSIATALGSPRWLFWGIAVTIVSIAIALPSMFVTYDQPLLTMVQWVILSGGIFFASLGLLQIIAPRNFWFYSRYIVRSAGISTAEQPGNGTLTVIRVRGALLLVFAIVAIMFAQFLFSQLLDGLSEFRVLGKNL